MIIGLKIEILINYLKFWKSSSAVFVVVNIIVAFTGFLRSFIFIKFLNLEQLGAITMVNTVAASLSLFQFGLINGGYRIIALGKKEEIEKTNNLIFSFISVISITLFIIAYLFNDFGLFESKLILFISMIIGVLMLINNWITNFLIGSQELRRLNIANIVSVLLSIFSLVAIYIDTFYGALTSLLIQPLVFLLISFSKKIRVTKFYLDVKYFKYILSFGFIPFLAGIFFLLYSQIERWTISSYLGNQELGKLYLFYLILTVSSLIPNSILNVYFPKAIKFYNDSDIVNFNRCISSNLKINILYCVTIVIGILLLLRPIVDIVFPIHLNYLYLIYFAIPGIVSKILTDPFALFFNSVIKLQPIFKSDLFSFLIYIICLVVWIFLFDINVLSFIILFDIYFITRLFFLMFFYYAHKIN